jgi:trk system potassium uptake protein TrkH
VLFSYNVIKESAGNNMLDSIDDCVQFGFMDIVGTDDKGNGTAWYRVYDRTQALLLAEQDKVRMVRIDGRVRPEGQVTDAFGYIFCYLFIVVVFAAVNIACGQDFITGVTASVACIGNVGPGFGDVGSMANYSDFPTILKSTGMIEMLVDRLEIFPILYLVRSIRVR